MIITKNERFAGFFRYPGSANALIIKNYNVKPNRIVLAINQFMLLKSIHINTLALTWKDKE